MEERYEVLAGDLPAGKVLLTRQGLYVRIRCRCQTPTEQVYRLFVVSGSRRESLGVVVPEGDGFSLDKKVPAKHLPDGQVQFILSTAGGQKRGEYGPIYPEEPFRYIDRLKKDFLEQQPACKRKRPA